MKTKMLEIKPLRPRIVGVAGQVVNRILVIVFLVLVLGGPALTRAHGQTLPHPAGSNFVAVPIPAQIEQRLRRFLEIAAEDPALKALLAKHQLTIQYSVSDLRLNLHVGFDGVKTVGAFGLPAQPPQLILVSDAGTLHRVLSGDNCDSEMKVTVHLGLIRKIKLSKDLDQIQAALVRIYTGAGRQVVDCELASVVPRSH